MDTYLLNYSNMRKHLVYTFSKGSGGIGDLLLFFNSILYYCMKYGIQIHYLNIDSSVEEFLKLKHHTWYIKQCDMGITQDLKGVDEIPNLQDDIYYIVKPTGMYGWVDCVEKFHAMIQYPLHDIFYFTEEVIQNVKTIQIPSSNYISIHLRLGDKFLETDMKYIACKGDTRLYFEERIFECIESNKDKNILFFCDNMAYKRKLKERYQFLNITEYEIGHTSLFNTTRVQVLNSVSDFYLLTKSDCIYRASLSGFPYLASLFHRIPVIDIYRRKT